MAARWRKSSLSAGANNCVELAWRKSICSEGVDNCVELAHSEAEFGIRDSKNTGGPALALTSGHGQAFLAAVRSDQLIRP